MTSKPIRSATNDRRNRRATGGPPVLQWDETARKGIPNANAAIVEALIAGFLFGAFIGMVLGIALSRMWREHDAAAVTIDAASVGYRGLQCLNGREIKRRGERSRSNNPGVRLMVRGRHANIEPVSSMERPRTAGLFAPGGWVSCLMPRMPEWEGV